MWDLSRAMIKQMYFMGFFCISKLSYSVSFIFFYHISFIIFLKVWKFLSYFSLSYFFNLKNSYHIFLSYLNMIKIDFYHIFWFLSYFRNMIKKNLCVWVRFSVQLGHQQTQTLIKSAKNTCSSLLLILHALNQCRCLPKAEFNTKTNPSG